MEVFTIDLSLNLMLTLVVLIHVTIRNSEFTDSYILICCTQIPPFMTLRSHSNLLGHQQQLILYAATYLHWFLHMDLPSSRCVLS